MVHAGQKLSGGTIERPLSSTPTFATALTIHDVGAAASKGVPLGGPLATGLRWSIARDAGIATNRFAAALVAYGVATTFVTWMLLFGVLLADVTQRSPTAVILLVAVPVPGGVGVVEAGLTGALVAAGVDPVMALAGVPPPGDPRRHGCCVAG